MATPSITEWDAQGNPLPAKATAPVAEWDEHGTPVQAAGSPTKPSPSGGLPPVPMGPLVGESLKNLAVGTGEGIKGATWDMGQAMAKGIRGETTGDRVARMLGPGAIAAKNIGVPMAQAIGHAGKFYYDWATGGQPEGTGTDRSNILPAVEGAASQGLGQGLGAYLGGSALNAGAFGARKMAAQYDINRGMDLTGKLIKNADHGENLSQAALGVYQGKIAPILKLATERIKAPMNAAYEGFKAKALQATGDTNVPATAMLSRMDKFIEDHPGVSDPARELYDKAAVRPSPQSIESLNRVKGEMWARAHAKATTGIDAKFYTEAYHAINDALSEHAKTVGATDIFSDALEHAKAYYGLKQGVVDEILENPYPRQGEHLTQLNRLFEKDGAVYKSLRNQLNDPELKRNYGLGDLGDEFNRYMDYTHELYKGMNNYARGFQGLFKSAADHPIASIAAYELLRGTPWLIRLFGVGKVAKMLNTIEAGEALRSIRGEGMDPAVFQEQYGRGTKVGDYPKMPPKAQTPPPGQPEPPRGSMGPVTPEERAQWGQSARSAKPVGADVARTSGTFGTSEEMNRGLGKALGEDNPNVKKAFAAEEARKAMKKKRD